MKNNSLLKSNVLGASVFVDGHKIGSTPLSEVSIHSGEHRIVVEKPGYDVYRKTIRVRKGSSRSLYVDLSTKAPQKGRLYVDTKPGEAKVTILNISPVFYQGITLNPGLYNIEVSADGYETQKKWVSLVTGEEKNVIIHLKSFCSMYNNFMG